VNILEAVEIVEKLAEEKYRLMERILIF